MKRVRLLAIALICLLISPVIFAVGQQESAGGEGPAGEKPYEIAVIIKATDSDFWQYLLVGAENYGKEHSDLVKVTTYGPPSEADIDKQVSILEDVVATNPDGIVIASTSSDATVPALEKAYDKGIAIITVDNRVNTDKVHSFLATDNKLGGSLAAEHMVDNMKANGIPLKGTVAVVSAMAGVQVLIDRDSGFTETMKKIAPEITVLEPRYVDNDIIKALGTAEDLITKYGDELVGVFADNNHTADGVARAIGEQGLKDRIMVTAYDSDPEEVNALRDGIIKALIVQDPYGMGYKGVDSAVMSIQGSQLPEFLDTGATAITPENMDEPAMQGLLDPFSLKK